MNYEKMSGEIIKSSGGRNNIRSIWNCFTRLRFDIVDLAQVNILALEAINGVMGVQIQGGQLQVIIGNRVLEIYDIVIEHWEKGVTESEWGDGTTPKHKSQWHVANIISQAIAVSSARKFKKEGELENEQRISRKLFVGRSNRCQPN